MNVRRGQIILMVVLVSVSTLFGAKRKNENTESFTFGKADLALLDQADLLDKKLEREGMVYHEEAIETYVNQVGRAMLPSGSAPERVMWAFRVLRDPMPNAFALPNGSIYVTTGLLSKLENEDQLAGVLAHEITHVTDRHPYLAYRDYRKKSEIASLVSYGASFAPLGDRWGTAIHALGIVTPAIMRASILGYDRQLERDADIYAYGKLAEGHYDPREMVNTFRLLEISDEVNVQKVYYNDHPKLEDRIAYMLTLISSKPPIVVPPDLLAQRRMKYLTLTERVDREDIHLAILSRRPRTALARATKLTDFDPDSAPNLCAKADAYRALGPWTAEPTAYETSQVAKKRERRLESRSTFTEEERTLLNTGEGQRTSQENDQLAEETYHKALAVDPANAEAYRGLGALYEAMHKNRDALVAYQKYLELQPEALDRQVVKGRILALGASANR